LLGAFYYLSEANIIKPTIFIVMIVFVLGFHYSIIADYALDLKGMHFAILGVGIFTLFWLLRNKLSSNNTLILISGLTYSVYLFHNWLFALFKKAIEYLKIPISSDLVSIILLFLTCLIAFHLIEKNAIKLGNIFILKFMNRQRG
jgi:peptidoglycan/LPS O-acetylase OafA/YrhL